MKQKVIKNLYINYSDRKKTFYSTIEKKGIYGLNKKPFSTWIQWKLEDNYFKIQLYKTRF